MDADGRLRFPDLPTAPGICECRLRGSSGSSVYIGETDNLRRRATHYSNPGPRQFSNIRLNGRLRIHLEAGGSAEVAVVTSAALLAAEGSTPLNLAVNADRRIVELPASFWPPPQVLTILRTSRSAAANRISAGERLGKEPTNQTVEPLL